MGASHYELWINLRFILPKVEFHNHQSPLIITIKEVNLDIMKKKISISKYLYETDCFDFSKNSYEVRNLISLTKY